MVIASGREDAQMLQEKESDWKAGSNFDNSDENAGEE